VVDYVGVLIFLTYRMAFRRRWTTASSLSSRSDAREGWRVQRIDGISPLSGRRLGTNARDVGHTAAGRATNSVIVTLPSFSAFASHLGSAQFDWLMLALTSVTAVIGAQLGARFMTKRVKSLTLSRLFALALVLLAAQRAYLLLAG
jgi:uncharacterized membrane protein YfcA